jgi:glycine betaine/choline ABC-type transport system substrate-binding protein
MIRCESVSKQYPDGTIAVHDLNLEAPSHLNAANAVSAKLTTDVLTTLDTKVAAGAGADTATVASEWLKQQGLT